MFCISISRFISTFMAVAIAFGHSGQDTNSESSTAEPVQEVMPDPAVDLGSLLDAGEGAVVSLVSGDTRLLAHRAVLAARSPVLQRLLQDAATGEVAVPDVEGPVLRRLLAYLYTLQAPQLPGMAPQLLAAAHQYGLPALKAECERQVATQLTVQTAVATAVLAVRYSSVSLMNATIAFIRAHIFHVMATQDWADAIRSQPEVMIKVTQLLSQLPPETRRLSPAKKGRRLIEAAKKGTVGELEALLAAGADVGFRDGDSVTALHYASEKGHVMAARRLLAAGAAVDARDGIQGTPLHYAARQGHAAVVRLLLAAGADLSARKSYGLTPLHLAALNDNLQVAEALLAAGADERGGSDDGRTPLDLARYGNYQQMVDLLERNRSLTATK